MDRKAWIVIVLCCIGLAVNFYFSGQNREALLEQQQKEEQAEKKRQEQERKAAEARDVDPSGDPGAPVPELTEPPEQVVEEKTVILSTSGAVFTFTTHGGGIKHVEMLGQYEVGDEENQVRINGEGEHPIGVLTNGPDKYLDIKYQHLEDLDTPRSVTFLGFLGEPDNRLYIRKQWSLLDDEEVDGHEFRLRLEITFENDGESAVELADYGLFAGAARPLWKGEWDRHIMFFYQKDGDYKKYRVTKFKKGKKKLATKDAGSVGYAGVSNQFFVTLIEPEEPYDAWVWGDRARVMLPDAAGGGSGESIRMGFSLPEETLTSSGDNSEQLAFELYLGPKRNLILRKTGADRGDVMNYKPFSWISNPLNWLLNALFGWIFSRMSDTWGWGFAIVALTIIIRAAMWPLQNKSTRAMKRMSKLQPQIKELREKYPDDPGRMNQEMMKMYRDYGINPLGGCLPLLVQIPIFFGFYIMLQYAVELRQKEFLWVPDLSLPDTLFNMPFSLPFLGNGFNLLPIVMAVTMVLQMALTPKTGDKLQRRLFMLMPVVFFFFCYNFASALALYWTTSNIFAIVQMLITRRLPEPELRKKKSSNKKGFFQRMQERAEAAQKAQKEMRSRQMGGGGPSKPKKRRPRTGG